MPDIDCLKTVEIDRRAELGSDQGWIHILHLQDGQACRRRRGSRSRSESRRRSRRARRRRRKEEAVGTRADLRSDQGWSHVLHLQDGQAGQLLVDALEDVVVEVPGLVQLRLLAAVPVLVAPLICL